MEKDLASLNYPIFIPFILFYFSVFLSQVKNKKKAKYILGFEGNFYILDLLEPSW
jgi:hypothetical protein